MWTWSRWGEAWGTSIDRENGGEVLGSILLPKRLGHSKYRALVVNGQIAVRLLLARKAGRRGIGAHDS